MIYEKSFLLASVSILAGCASTDIIPIYANPNTYQNYDCLSLHKEIQRLAPIICNTKYQSKPINNRTNMNVTSSRNNTFPHVGNGDIFPRGYYNECINANLSNTYDSYYATMIMIARQKNVILLAQVLLAANSRHKPPKRLAIITLIKYINRPKKIVKFAKIRYHRILSFLMMTFW